MNVKPGDLARVVAPYDKNGRGAFVKVIRAAIGRAHRLGENVFVRTTDLPAWVVEGWVRGDRNVPVGPQLVIHDRCLRRVDPGKATDETLSWKEVPAGKPQEIEA